MSNLKLYDFQEETIQYGIAHPYTIYALQQGLGKSVCAIETAIRTKSKTLIIVPSYLKLKWKSEIHKFYPDVQVSLLNNDREFYRLWDTDFCIISYSFIGKSDKLFEWADMVVLDEVTMLKNMEAKRSMEAHRLIYENSIKRCLLLTGTPIMNRVWEFYSLICLCNYNPQIAESAFLKKFPTYVEFANHFSFLNEKLVDIWDAKKGKKTKKIVRQWEGFRNIDELREILKGCYIRFTADEVLDLPESMEIEIPVDLTSKPELLREFEKYADTGDESSVASNIKAQAALAKAPFTVEYVERLLEECEQVVVFSDHVLAAQKIAEGLGTTAITGATDDSTRQRMANEFMSGKRSRIVATIGSMGIGVDLQAASNLVFNDPSWIPGNMDQARYRIRRIGQKNRCNFHHIVGSIQDRIIYKRLADKIATINAVI